ncbi:MAG: hypothetical protein HYZ20_18535 [Burkholderiales bacterium]|nr:hypothetical protein [Burkholderiales bacterium]
MNQQAHDAYAVSVLPAAPPRGGNCPMCGRTGGGASCAGCGAPLAPPPHFDDGLEAWVGRRGSPRVDRDEAALWLPAGAARPQAVQLLDLSFSGLRVASALPAAEGAVARVRTEALDAVVEVVRCRAEGGRWLLHARLLTLRLLQRSGAFVSATA